MTTNRRAKKGSSKGRGRKGRPDGSPITIGGGGGIGGEGNLLGLRPIWCTFDDADYPEPAGGAGKKTFTNNKGWHMESLTLTANNHTIDLTPLLPANGDCQIKVECPGNNDDVTIFGRPFGVQFHTGKYLKEGQVHKSSDAGRYVSKVIIEFPDFYLEKKFTEDDDCGIYADHVPTGNRAVKTNQAKS